MIQRRTFLAAAFALAATPLSLLRRRPAPAPTLSLKVSVSATVCNGQEYRGPDDLALLAALAASNTLFCRCRFEDCGVIEAKRGGMISLLHCVSDRTSFKATAPGSVLNAFSSTFTGPHPGERVALTLSARSAVHNCLFVGGNAHELRA